MEGEVVGDRGDHPGELRVEVDVVDNGGVVGEGALGVHGLGVGFVVFDVPTILSMCRRVFELHLPELHGLVFTSCRQLPLMSWIPPEPKTFPRVSNKLNLRVHFASRL